MSAAVDRTISSSMGNLSRRIKLILKNEMKSLKKEITRLEVENEQLDRYKRMAEVGRDMHMREKQSVKKELGQTRQTLSRAAAQLERAKQLARQALKDKKVTETELKQALAELGKKQSIIEESQRKIESLEAMLEVADKALKRVNQSKLRF